MWTCRAARKLATALVPSHKLRYVLEGSETHVLRVELTEGQSVIADPGALVTMTSGVEMSTEVKGGLMQSVGRMISGAGLLMTTFKNIGQGTAELLLGPDFYSKVLVYPITPDKPLICQRHSFLCSEEVPSTQDIRIDPQTISPVAGLMAGGGLVHQKVSGAGLVFLQASGTIFEMELKAEEKWSVRPGSWVAYEPSVKFEVTRVLGVKNMLFGQGLVLVHFTGPGKVIMQSMPADRVSDVVEARRPKKSLEKVPHVGGGKEGSGLAGTITAATIGGQIGTKQTEGVGQPIPVGEAEETKPVEDTEHDTEFMAGDGGEDSGGGVDDGNRYAVGPSE